MTITIQNIADKNTAFIINGDMYKHRTFNTKYISDCGMVTTYGDGLTAHSPTIEIPTTQYGNFCESVCKFIHHNNQITIANDIASRFQIARIVYENWEKLCRYVESYKNGGKIPYYNSGTHCVSTAEKYAHDTRWHNAKYIEPNIYGFTNFFGVHNDMFHCFSLVNEYQGNTTEKYKFLSDYFSIPTDTTQFNHLITWATRFNDMVKSFYTIDIMFSRHDFNNNQQAKE